MTRNPQLIYRPREDPEDEVFFGSGHFSGPDTKEAYVMHVHDTAKNLPNDFFQDESNRYLTNDIPRFVDRDSARNNGFSSFNGRRKLVSGNVAYVQPMFQKVASPVAVQETHGYLEDDDVHFITGGTYTRLLSNYNDLENSKEKKNLYLAGKMDENLSGFSAPCAGGATVEKESFYNKAEEFYRLREENSFLRSHINCLTQKQPETDDDFEEIIEETTTTTRKLPKEITNSSNQRTFICDYPKQLYSIGVGDCDVNQYFILDTGSNSINPDSFPPSYWERLSSYFSSQFKHPKHVSQSSFSPQYCTLPYSNASDTNFKAQPTSFRSFGVNVKPTAFPTGTNTDFKLKIVPPTSDFSCMTDDLDEYFARLLRSLSPQCPNADAAFIRNLYRYSQSNCSEFIRRLSLKLNELGRQSRIDEPKRIVRTDSVGVSMRPTMSDKRTSSLPPNCYSLGINTEFMVCRSRGIMHTPLPPERSSIGCSTSSFIKKINNETQCVPTSSVQDAPREKVSIIKGGTSEDLQGALKHVTECTTKVYRTRRISRMSQDDAELPGILKGTETFGPIEGSLTPEITRNHSKKHVEPNDIHNRSRSENIYLETWDTTPEPSYERTEHTVYPSDSRKQVYVKTTPVTYFHPSQHVEVESTCDSTSEPSYERTECTIRPSDVRKQVAVKTTSDNYLNPSQHMEMENTYVDDRRQSYRQHSATLPVLISPTSHSASSSSFSDDTTINYIEDSSVVIPISSMASSRSVLQSKDQVTRNQEDQTGRTRFVTPAPLNMSRQTIPSMSRSQPSSCHTDEQQLDKAIILNAFHSSMCPRSADNKTPVLPKVVKFPLRNYSLKISEPLKTSFESVGRWCVSGGALGSISTELQDHLINVYRKWFDEMSKSDIDTRTVEDLFAFIYNSSPELLYMFTRLPYFTGETCLHFAVGHGAWRVVSLILDTNYADPDRTNNCGFSPVMIAAICNSLTGESLKVLDRLFKVGHVNLTAKTKTQESPLILAAKKATPDVVRCLLSHDANINYQDASGNTALMCAVEWQKVDIVQVLLSYPDIRTDIQDKNRKTALDIAKTRRQKDILDLLLASENGQKSVDNSSRRQTHHISSHIFRREDSTSSSQESSFSVIQR